LAAVTVFTEYVLIFATSGRKILSMSKRSSPNEITPPNSRSTLILLTADTRHTALNRGVHVPGEMKPVIDLRYWPVTGNLAFIRDHCFII